MTAVGTRHGAAGPPDRAARRLRPLLSSVLRAAWRVRVHGGDVIPRQGPAILAANHTGFLDGPLLYSVVKRPVHALVKNEMFTPPLGWALRSLGQIPVDRFACDMPAVQSCLAVLQRGGLIAIYPEGTRGSGTFEQTKPGVAYVALRTGAPVIPVVGLGVRTSSSVDGLPRLRSTIDVVFGEPIETTPIPWPRRRHVVRDHADLITEHLRAHVRDACALTGREVGPVRYQQPLDPS
ncbi:1-acyl-sn-glycerol-3-phosphate acyltransferase [Actinobacteria bacterium YIM 96077]|uniref:1-acyl-sn-glycerol-3-phosphate acyltransferase n=1 Tax=Phytoactinopolyspora halophila TaxID=1981511 RepID=A0A329QE85_9ACTN|nr:lysophospholipid acyltransferase family protein [Phytoactinopolyspora halophila]AYY13579.1 1-acyl-sn-glycerol-3-phosphate acyltransferase [Actinobacteria bacterium YIM 96077]RAW10755.1 1-acyl-sn-glycerol-3-phosphate acyltransferase [Phytoactinopolyspora halophila]